jgi:multidrug resistance efflux pump
MRFGQFRLLLGLGVVAALGTAGAGRAAETAAARPALERGDFERRLLLTGELEAVRSISIKSPQTNVFQMRIQFMAEEGRLVRAGEPVLGFDSSYFADQVRELEVQILDAETQIVSRESELASTLKDLEIELAEREYEYGRAKLEAEVDPEVLSRKEFGERELAFTKATRELEETRERIELTRSRGQAELDVLVINRDKLKADLLKAQEALEVLSIEAPADGLVVYEHRPQSTLRFQEGDSCWPGQQVIRLPDLSEMQAVFSVNEVDAPLLEEGMPLRVTLDAFAGRELEGRLTVIPSMAVKRDEESKIRIFKVVAELSETWVGEMKPGMSVRGEIVLDRREDVPLVARRAVSFDGREYRLRGGVEGEPGPVLQPVARNATHYVISEEQYAELGRDAGPTVQRAGFGVDP